MAIVDISAVRTAGGFPSDLITNEDISHALEVIEEYVERAMNCSLIPKQLIEFQNGANKSYVYTDFNPLLRVDYISNLDVEIEIEDIFLNRESGRIDLKINSPTRSFIKGFNSVKLVYWSGFLIKSKATHIIQDFIFKGSNVDINLDDASDYEVNDWLEIMSKEGEFVCVKIVNKLVNTITVDYLPINISQYALVYKLVTPEYIKRLIELEAVIYLSLNSIGATYVFNASYSLGDLNVTKGVPYTHWRESLEKAIKERNTLKSIIKPRFKIV
jgi:hypothetical protein